MIQYGKRSSTKHKASHITHPNKRQKLVKDAELPWGRPSLEQSQCRSDTHSKTPSPTHATKPKSRESSPISDEVLIPTRENTPLRSPRPSVDTSDCVTPPSRRKPKDLSGIFAPFPQLTSKHHSPAKSVANRMVVRSRTDPILASPPFPDSSPRAKLTSTPSLPNIPTTLQPKQRHSPSSSKSSPVVVKPNVRTYSQSRSFLVALPAAITPKNGSTHAGPDPYVADDPLLGSDGCVRESYSDLRNRWGVDCSENDPCHVSGITNDLMSITELRSKGESRRFLDDMGYLFEGLEEPDMSVSVRRSSAAEIVSKMCDAEFVRKAKAANFLDRAWDALRSAGAGNDKILDPYLVCFVALVAHDRREIDDLGRKKEFFDLMIRLLQIRKEHDVLDQTEGSHVHHGLARAEKVALKNLCGIMNASDWSTSPSVLSIRHLASYALSRVTPSLYPDQLLPAAVESLLAELTDLHLRMDAYVSDLGTVPDMPDLKHIDHCIRILDKFLISPQSTAFGKEQMDAKRGTLCSGLIALCVVLVSLDSNNEWYHMAGECIESCFRVLVNLSHLSVEWCQRLTDSSFLLLLTREISQDSDRTVKREEDVLEDTFATSKPKVYVSDRQCLALALLSNVVFAVDETRTLLREISLNPSCPGGRHCALSCQCPKRINTIECLVSSFTRASLKSDLRDTLELDHFQCHLAALLCIVTVGSPVNRQIVRKGLPDLHVEDKYKRLSESVRLFLGLYSDARIELSTDDMNVENDVPTRVVSALEALFAES